VTTAPSEAAARLWVEPAAWEAPFAWEALFGRARPVEVELGCGKGMFLKEAARLFPERSYLGVDWAGKYLRVAAERVGRAGLDNVRLLRADGLDVLSRWVPPGSVGVIHVYFPDPWPKKRHHKRRIVRPALLDLAEHALGAGGEIRVATDDVPYADEIRALFAADTGRFVETPWPEDDPERLPTNYACKWQRAGRTLWWARYRRVARVPA
jgi:tRNA (guanine-N7-)-methyltransferase